MTDLQTWPTELRLHKDRKTLTVAFTGAVTGATAAGSAMVTIAPRPPTFPLAGGCTSVLVPAAFPADGPVALLAESVTPPTAVTGIWRRNDATARWDNTYQALKQTLVIQATIASALDQDGQTLRTLMANSSGAVGSLQAQQSSNELLALQIKQSLQAQALEKLVYLRSAFAAC